MGEPYPKLSAGADDIRDTCRELLGVQLAELETGMTILGEKFVVIDRGRVGSI